MSMGVGQVGGVGRVGRALVGAGGVQFLRPVSASGSIVEAIGDSAFKNTGVTAWDGGAVSVGSFTGSAFGSGRAGTRIPTANDVMLGLTAAGPAYTGVFSDLDYAWFIPGGPAWADIQIYESGVYVDTPIAAGAWTIDDVFSIHYQGTSVIYYRNGVQVGAPRVTTAGRQLYFATSHHTVDSGVRDIQFNAGL